MVLMMGHIVFMYDFKLVMPENLYPAELSKMSSTNDITF